MKGFYQAENIKSETLVNCTKNALCRIKLPLTNWKIQFYDGASNMVDAKIEVETCINEIESRAHLTHCHGHAYQLVISDIIKVIKILRGNLEAAFELN